MTYCTPKIYWLKFILKWFKTIRDKYPEFYLLNKNMISDLFIKLCHRYHDEAEWKPQRSWISRK